MHSTDIGRHTQVVVREFGGTHTNVEKLVVAIHSQVELLVLGERG